MRLFLLAYQDSNLDKQNQNLSYYHYTIGQYQPSFLIWECKNKGEGNLPQNFFVGNPILKLPGQIQAYFRASMFSYTWQNELLVLHPWRCLFWGREQALILSDLHFGKTGHFRKEGIAVPQDVFRHDLDRLTFLIQHFGPKRLLMVGDLFHSRSNLEWEWFAQWRNGFSNMGFTLISGNHDKVEPPTASRMNLQVIQRLEIRPFLFVHDAREILSLPEQVGGIVSGHIHPAVSIPSGPRQSLRLPCFHFTPTHCTLPAFGLFTGMHTIKPHAKDTVFAIGENEIIRVGKYRD